MKLFKKKDVVLQTAFLEKIKELVPDNYSLADELSEVLDISSDSAYRRLRGKTLLSINEVAKLCQKYNISFDLFTQNTENVTFAYKSLETEEDLKIHMLSILDSIYKTSKPANKSVTYAAIDIPLFYHFMFDELGAFKIFYWMKAVNNYSSVQNKKFDLETVNPEILAIGKQIWAAYKNAPCVEIWSDETGNSLVKQIEFYWDSGNFKNKKDALTVCDQAKKQLETIQEQAEVSSKNLTNNRNDDSKFMLYHSDIEIGNNCIFAKRNDTKFVFLTFNTFNSLLTANVKFTKEIEGWLDNLIKKSTLISGTAQKYRFQFFERAIKKVDLLYDKILNS